jgi:hypothetical protein
MAFAARVFGEPRGRSARRRGPIARGVVARRAPAVRTRTAVRANAYLDDHAFLLGAMLEAMQGGVLRRPT